MSIINDALKKVQQGLNIKSEDPQVNQSTTKQNASAYMYENSLPLETLPPADQQTTGQKPPIQNKIKSLFALVCALMITVASVLYIWQQFQKNIPRVQTFAQKSLYQLIHKQRLPNFKTNPLANPRPLAQLTINPSTVTTSNSTKAAPITLDIRGVMSDANGNLVLINDQVYQEGDEVDGAKIVKINLDSIKVINNGIEQTIFVKN